MTDSPQSDKTSFEEFLARIKEAEQLAEHIDFSDKSKMKAVGQSLHKLHKKLKRAATKEIQARYNANAGTLDDLLKKIDEVMTPQELQFLINGLPHIQQSLFDCIPPWKELSFLDVGPRFGFGADLIATLYRGLSLGYKLNVEAIDLFDHWANYTYLSCPELKLTISDIGNVPDDQTWDIVYCSGVIEHVENTDDFLNKLLRITKRLLFVMAPYNENPITVPSHIQTITEETFANHSPLKTHVFKSCVWRPHDRQNFKMIMATFKK